MRRELICENPFDFFRGLRVNIFLRVVLQKSFQIVVILFRSINRDSSAYIFKFLKMDINSAGPYYVEPSTYAGTAITVKAGQREAYLDRDSTRLVFVYPGLTGEGGTVSLQIADRDYIDHYLKFDKDTEQLIFATVDRSDPFDPGTFPFKLTSICCKKLTGALIIRWLISRVCCIS